MPSIWYYASLVICRLIIHNIFSHNFCSCVCVCLYVYMYVCMYVCMYVSQLVYVYAYQWFHTKNIHSSRHRLIALCLLPITCVLWFSCTPWLGFNDICNQIECIFYPKCGLFPLNSSFRGSQRFISMLMYRWCWGLVLMLLAQCMESPKYLDYLIWGSLGLTWPLEIFHLDSLTPCLTTQQWAILLSPLHRIIGILAGVVVIPPSHVNVIILLHHWDITF